MTAFPQPSAFEAETNDSFEALMWALSRPGLPRDFPAAGFEPIIKALIDRECRVHCASESDAELAQKAGADLTSIERADHVFLDTIPDPQILARLNGGSDLYPETGATLVVPVVSGEGPPLRLTGPGVDGSVVLSVRGLPNGFWATRRRVMRYPQGFEIFLVDGCRVIGIPRSTHVEEL